MDDDYTKTTGQKLPVICLYSDPYYHPQQLNDVPDMVTSVEGILSFRKTRAHKTGTESSIERPTYLGLKTNSNSYGFDGAWTLMQPEQLNDHLRRLPNGKRFIELTDDVSGEKSYVQIDNIKKFYPYIPDHKMSAISYHHPDQAGPVRIRESVDAIYKKINQELVNFPTTSPSNVNSDSETPPKEEGDFLREGRQRDLSPDFGGASLLDRNGNGHELERRREEAEEQRRKKEREEQMALHKRTLEEQLEVERLSRQMQEHEQARRQKRDRGLSR